MGCTKVSERVRWQWNIILGDFVIPNVRACGETALENSGVNPYEAAPAQPGLTNPLTPRPRSRFVTLFLLSLLLVLNFASLIGTYNCVLFFGGQGSELTTAIGWLQLVSPVFGVCIWGISLVLVQSNIFDFTCMLLALAVNWYVNEVLIAMIQNAV